MYQPTAYHWTDSLYWSNVTNANTVSGMLQTTSKPDSFVVDQSVFNTKMDEISASVGGVLYFPAGEYYFAEDLALKSNVIIRGEASEIESAKTAGFEPKTKFIFPKWLPGTPRASAFKEVGADTNGISKAGFVNIDLNRAVIGIYGGGYTKNINGVTYEKWQPTMLSKRIIIMGVRHNNAAIPDPSSPSASQQSQGATANTQAWPWRFGNNISVSVSENCVIANCRLNDNPTDNFIQPDYKLNNNATIPNVAYTEFNYLHHSGIDLNRNKVFTRGPGYYGGGEHGKYGLEGFVNLATPEKEPTLFRPGLEIRDNWVKTLTRVKIIAAGNGLIIDNNTLMDDGGKIYYLTENGQGVQGNNSATYENRGIDVSGWNVKLSRNNIFVQQGKIRSPTGYPSVDGEGILVQECCGGTTINGFYFSENKLAAQSSGYIGLWKMRDLNNVEIRKNDLGGKFIYTTADVNGCDAQISSPCHKLNGVIIDSNYNVSTIVASGKAGGSQCNNRISRNILTSGTGVGIRHTENIILATDNQLNGKTVVTSTINGTLGDASGTLTAPAADTTIANCTASQVTFSAKVDCGVADSVVFYISTASGNQRLGQATFTGDQYNYVHNISPTTPGTLFYQQLVGRIFSNNGNGAQWTRVVAIRKECQLPVEPLSVNPNGKGNLIQLVPNPTDSRFLIKGISAGDHVTVFDAVGKKISSKKIGFEDDSQFDVTTNHSGIYFIHVSGKGNFRLVKK